MSRFLPLLLAVFLALPVPPALAAKPQAVCPVMGGTVDKSVYADHKGQRVYFCCAACIPEFKKDPDKYIAKLKAQGVEPEPVPQGSPQPPKK